MLKDVIVEVWRTVWNPSEDVEVNTFKDVAEQIIDEATEDNKGSEDYAKLSLERDRIYV